VRGKNGAQACHPLIERGQGGKENSEVKPPLSHPPSCP
jgi:hypothetical protein